MATDNKHRDGSIAEETAAFGQRVKGAAKDGVGAVTGNSSLEREGELENAEGRRRQAQNNAVGGQPATAIRLEMVEQESRDRSI